MPFINDLLKYKNEFFIETGTYCGDTITIVYDANQYNHIYSLELSPVFYNNCKEKFKNIDNITIFHANSKTDLYNIIKFIDKPITFWLDSHWSGVENIGYDSECYCPILFELEQIKQHNIKTHTIMIDDMRLMTGVKNDMPFNNGSFTVTKENIIEKIMEINENYKINYYSDNTSNDDILVAYIE